MLEGRERLTMPCEKYTVDISSEKDLGKIAELTKDLFGDEGSEQLVFVLKSLSEKDFTNHCNEATQALGRSLATRYGEENSFFEEVPWAKFADAKNYEGSMRSGYAGDFHSVALIEVDRDQTPKSLVIDLTYYTVSGSTKFENLIIKIPGGEPEALQVLGEQYGGKWKIDYHCDPKTGNFVFEDH